MTVRVVQEPIAFLQVRHPLVVVLRAAEGVVVQRHDGAVKAAVIAGPLDVLVQAGAADEDAVTRYRWAARDPGVHDVGPVAGAVPGLLVHRLEVDQVVGAGRL